MHAIVNKLVVLIEKNKWQEDFQRAINNAQSHNVHSIKNIQNLNDYLHYINDLVTWPPESEVTRSTDVTGKSWPSRASRTFFS